VLLSGDTTPDDVCLEIRHPKTKSNDNLGAISHSKLKKKNLFTHDNLGISYLASLLNKDQQIYSEEL